MTLSSTAFTIIMIKLIFIFLLFSFTMQNVRAQIKFDDSVYQTDIPADSLKEMLDDKGEEVLLTDTILTIRAITISEDTIRQWKNKKEYGYIKNLDSLLKLPPDKESSSENFRFPTVSLLDRIFSGALFKLILVMLAAFFVLSVLYGFFKNKGIFKRQFTKGIGEEELPAEEDKLDQDFDELVHQNHKLGDYRMALRYQFLKTLQLLRDHNHVEYGADKTNSQYMRELPAHWQNEFAKLILSYEYVWYGNFIINKQQYEPLQAGYISFQKKI